MAALMAVEKGWGINLGGGMHHASHDEGMGWCFYSDIFLAIRRVRQVGVQLYNQVNNKRTMHPNNEEIHHLFQLVLKRSFHDSSGHTTASDCHKP